MAFALKAQVRSCVPVLEGCVRPVNFANIKSRDRVGQRGGDITVTERGKCWD